MTDSRAAHAHPPAYSVDIQGVSQHFMQGDTRIDVLKNIDLKVRYGEVVAILGPSGSGKSTLLNILGLLSTPASGSYLLDGTDTATFNAAQRAEARLDSIGFVFQAFHLIEHKNVYRNVEPTAHLPWRAQSGTSTTCCGYSRSAGVEPPNGCTHHHSLRR